MRAGRPRAPPKPRGAKIFSLDVEASRSADRLCTLRPSRADKMSVNPNFVKYKTMWKDFLEGGDRSQFGTRDPFFKYI